MNRQTTIWATIGGVLILGLAGWFFFFSGDRVTPLGGFENATTTPPVLSGALNNSISFGGITVAYPASFGLAINTTQILWQSYIPPCDPKFDYCFYYKGSKYQGTNFESAGIRIERRMDLGEKSACLSANPAGYSNLQPTIKNTTTYSSSVFSPIGDAGLGHFASGDLYRLFYKDICYEFETRIGQSQFQNYEPGTIKEFTDRDEVNIRNVIQTILKDIKLEGGENNLFPPNELKG